MGGMRSSCAVGPLGITSQAFKPSIRLSLWGQTPRDASGDIDDGNMGGAPGLAHGCSTFTNDRDLPHL